MVHLFHGREFHDLGSRLSDALHDEVPYFVHDYNLPSFDPQMRYRAADSLPIGRTTWANHPRPSYSR